ncbi:MAG: FAD-dependent thymidylate synthase [Actinomycetota bacterium]|jgi:thymidylate synthase ThyX|nr:FAD-dependent thymidylate synthase [Actinomycetota bacterium]
MTGHPYAAESFTPEEREVLAHYVTNLDGPVFALVNLPEVVMGALFARYSRSAKSLRRLFLDEFVDDLDVSGDATMDASVGLRRAEELYARVFGEYGDDSVAQLGGVHLACEQASNVLTKVLERGRLMSYLEQSTRYVPYDSRMPTGHYRYYRDPELLESPYGARFVGDMDRMFDTYAGLLEPLSEHLRRVHPPRGDISPIAYRQSIRARALDALRGLLPAGSLSNVGIYGSGQSFELLLLHLRDHPLPEARHYGALMLAELRKVIPSFLTRVDRPDRGVAWADYLSGRREEMAALVASWWPEESVADAPMRGGLPGAGNWSVDLVDFDPAGEDKVLVACCYPYVTCAERELERAVAGLSPEARAALMSAYVGERANRRHRPGRAFERTGYRFDIVSDYGAFRDLQRHRMLTVEWQPLSTELGWSIPELIVEAGLADTYLASLERSFELHALLAPHFGEAARYAIALGFFVRYSLDCSAREAMHIIELRSSPQGHPTYRRIAQEMHRLIAERAGHRAIAAAMSFVDHTSPDLGRLAAEQRAALRKLGIAQASTP